ncbi:MAG: phospho-N-acetylmuramoyl-pentapeptide-transferase [Lachnospiraceae bacterium]|nr:phospho-N-acetylmuramoyl-pentapeptide-transferase [Lachnospiraceae bacterium]
MNKNDVILPILISFGISVILSPIVIPFLKKLKFGQFVRDDGPESHLKKSGTPTMGGLIILVSIVITSLFYLKDYPRIIPVLFATLGFGIIGFLDDYIKVVMKRSMGLRAWQKMLGQLVITGVFAYYIYAHTDLGTDIIIPFMNKSIDIEWLYFPLMFFVMLGTVNGANFTDGLDGLASSVTVLIATFFTIVAVAFRSGIEPITCATVGSLLGFLVYNVYPARVFMGDTGSLALGGFVASTAYVLKMPLIILIVAFIYFAEVLSVIIQVTYFKKTGKRVFKMAPIHHHFELCGWPETKVVAIFSIITAILCLVGMLAVNV